MTIALIILHADPARGGAERYTVDLAAALATRGQSVSLLSSDFTGPLAGVRQVSLASGGGTRRGRYLRFLDSLDAHLARDHYDIVHAMLPVRRCDIYHPHAGLAAQSLASGHLKYDGGLARAAAKLGNRLNRKRQLVGQVERRLLTSPRSPVVLCLSEYVKRDIVNHYDLPAPRMETLFNAVDLKRFDPAIRNRHQDRRELALADGQIVALMMAQDFARKGLRQAIEALACLQDRRLLLLVAGKDRREPYEKLARSLGVSEQVRFAGNVSDPCRLYGVADFFVLPTKHDPCSLVVLEALVMGLPVISTVFNGACEVMQSGKHGFVLTDPQDVSALTEAMRKLLDSSAREEMKSAAIALRPRLSFDAHVDRLLQIYHSCSNLSQKSTAR